MKKAIVFLFVLIAVVLAFTGIFENEAMYGRIHADAQGYYGYLVALILEQSFDWETVIHSYSDVYFDGNGADFTVTTDLGRINKYYVGTAVMMLPFFLLSCLAAVLLDFPVDGYSVPFQHGLVLGALFYSGIGIYYLVRFMEAKNINTSTALFASVLCLFATPLFHYSVSEPAMSHAYSFGLFSVFLYSVSKWFKVDSRKHFVIAALAFGLIVLIRPANGLIILSLPFIAGGFENLIERIKRENHLFQRVAVAGLIMFVILSVQSAMYLMQVGKPVVWSYQGEGFDFLNPQVWNFLFSFKKGLFVYTPLALAGLVGILSMLGKRKAEAIWLLVFLTVIIFVLSSWWNWYYGGSMGMRAMIEYMPFFAFGLAYLIQISIPIIRYLIVTGSLFCVALNLIQSYQYQHFILHWDGMNSERYWQVFLKTDRSYDGIFYKVPSEEPVERIAVDKKIFTSNLDSLGVWGNQGVTQENAYSGLSSTKVNETSPYGSTLGVPVSELGLEGNKTLVITAMAWAEDALPGLSIAYSYRGAEGDYGHQYIGIGHQLNESKKWIKVQIETNLESPKDSLDNWIVYPHNPTPSDVFLDDIKYEVVTWE